MSMDTTDYPGMMGNDIQYCLSQLDEPSGNDLHAWQYIVHTINVSKGWFDAPRDFGTECMLIVTEVAEIMEAWRENGLQSRTRWIHREINHDGFEITVDGSDRHNSIRANPGDRIGKPEGVASEAADVLVRLLDFCERYDINLTEALCTKLKFNMTRPYKHGNKRV